MEKVERFYKQAWETVFLHQNEICNSCTINAFNRRVDTSGFSPTLTTRPDGFKTSILVLRMEKE